MESGVGLFIYGVLAVTVAGILTLRSSSKSRFITFVISFWILGASVIHPPTFTIQLRSLGGDLQVGRIIMLILLVYLLVSAKRKRETSMPVERLPYEKYFYAYFIWWAIVVLYHSLDATLPGRELVRLIDDSLRMILMYLVLKTDADAETIKVLGKSLIIVAVFSSLAAIVQFFINPGFLRVVAGRPAFGGHLRSQGVFNAEFLHSYYLIAALAFTALWVKSARIKWALIGLFLIGIALSFHRMSWIVACVLFLVYLALERRESSLKVIVLGGTLAFLLYFLGTEVFPIMDAVESSTVVRSRVADDTMTGRMRQYAMVLERFDDIAVWGAGSWGSDAYYSGMISIGLREWASGQRGGIHNLYLALLFIYGLPAALLFCIALASIHIYIWRAYSRRGTIALFPLLFLVMYWIMNLTNSFPLTSEFGVFVGIVLGSSAAVLRTPLFAETANGISV